MTTAILQHLATLTRGLRDAIVSEMQRLPGGSGWSGLWRGYQEATGRGDKVHFADAVAQTVTCVHFSLRGVDCRVLPQRAREWLVEQAAPLVQRIFRLCDVPFDQVASDNPAAAASAAIERFLLPEVVSAVKTLCRQTHPGEDELIHFFEKFLREYDATARRRQGVFYTPRPVASFVVRSVDELLRDEFFLDDGLADCSTWRDVRQRAGRRSDLTESTPSVPFVRILDPAMGTGAFLVEVVRHIHRQFQYRHPDTPRAAVTQDQWDQHVAQSLLPRIFGQELMLPALVLCQIAMAKALAQTGYRFPSGTKMQLHLANTMLQPSLVGDDLPGLGRSFTVVVGNPPFSGISENRYSWIQQLLRGQSPLDGAPVANYFRVDGRPLGEKKHWLEDDYVKFMRFAHWQIELAGAGIVALVTNHGFLDNSTFRGMRQQLLAAFPRVTIVDLHGNKRNGERSPRGGKDDSVFSISQGVAVSLLRRPLHGAADANVNHADLWGTRQEKLETLDAATGHSLAATRLQPSSPYFFLVPRDTARQAEYERGYPLTDVMPVNSTAAVTARDGFVVAFSEAELRVRMTEFCDERISDESIRSRLFTTTRSSKYPPGDTRGWQLAEARRRLRAEAGWTRRIQECLYRPFDRRKVFWANWMIDWPREKVMDHLVDGNNLALVARRQAPPAQPWCYVWITDTVALDGLIRSDNRGSESVFPVFLRDGHLAAGSLFAAGPESSAGPSEAWRRPNFAPEFTKALAARLDLTWNADAVEHSSEDVNPLGIFHYIYALLHSPGYRQRYASWLQREFPRILIPRQADLFHQLSSIGSQLSAIHLRRSDARVFTRFDTPRTDVRIKPGYPKYRDMRIWLDENVSSSCVPAEVWGFRVGTYQVCQKWLKDRQGRMLRQEDLREYGQIIAAVESTLSCMQHVDEQIDRHGGWDRAFA